MTQLVYLYIQMKWVLVSIKSYVRELTTAALLIILSEKLPK